MISATMNLMSNSDQLNPCLTVKPRPGVVTNKEVPLALFIGKENYRVVLRLGQFNEDSIDVRVVGIGLTGEEELLKEHCCEVGARHASLLVNNVVRRNTISKGQDNYIVYLNEKSPLDYMLDALAEL